MILALRLAWRDLRGGIGRFTIFIACLALGIAAIAAVDTVSNGIELALREDGRAILGGDLTVRSLYVPATPDQLALLRTLGDVGESATMRAMATANGGATLVELKSVDANYPLYGKLGLADGGAFQDRLKPASAIVAPEILDKLGIQPGQALTLGKATLAVAGVIGHEPDAAGSTGFVLGPRLLISRQALDATGLIQPGSLVYWTYALRLKPDITLGDAHKALDDKAAAFGWQVRTYDNAASSLQGMLDRLSQFLTLVGVSALVVGGIGIANAVKAALDTRMQAIATMKCLGASRRTVFTVFLIEIVAMAGIGTIIGLVVGIGAPILAGPLLTALLPIAPRLVVNPGTVAASLGYGLLVTLIFALPSLFQAGIVSPTLLFRSRATPPALHLNSRQLFIVGGFVGLFCALLLYRSHDRQLAAFFLMGLLGSIALFARAGQGVSYLARRLQPHAPRAAEIKLALANLHRPGNRTSDMMISLGMGLSALVAIGLVESNFRHELTARVQGEAPSFFFLDVQKDQYEAFSKQVEAFPGASDFVGVPSLRGRIGAINGVPATRALKDKSMSWVLGSDRGITYSAALPLGSRLTEGEWWNEAKSTEPLLSITDGVARAFAIHPGDHMTLNIAGRDVTAKIANVRQVNWGSFNINYTLVMAPGTLEGAPQTWLATVHATPQAMKALPREIARQYPAVSTVDVSEVLATVDDVMGKIATAVRLAAGIILVTGVLVLLGAVSAGFERRTGESVIMKVLGATRPRLFRIFLMEYGAMGLCAAAIAVIVGTTASWWITNHIFGFEWVFYPRQVAAIVAIGLGVTLLIGFISTLLVLGRKSAPYLRTE